MKSAPFAYSAPQSTAEAVSLKREWGADARILAGGQSLIPLMHFRLATPACLIDINRIDELDYIERKNGTITVGARTRQAAALRSGLLADTAPLLHSAVRHVGHAQIRNRGTVAGSAAHADPSAEIPAVLLAIGAELVCTSPAGVRTVPAADFYPGPFETALADDEVLTEIRLPAWPDGTGVAWLELTRIFNGFPVVGVGALVHLENGVVERAAIGMCGMAPTPIAAPSAAQMLVGNAPSDELIGEVATEAVAHLDPPGDVHGSSIYRKRAGRAYVERAVRQAIHNAGGPQ